MTKKINPNLTAEQKLVLFEDGTEPPNTSELNFEKRKALYVGAQEHLYKTTGTLIPYHVSKLYVMNSRVSGIDAVENHTIRWNKVTVK